MTPPQRVSRIREVRLSAPLSLMPSGFLFNARNGESYSINRTGTAILRAIAAGKSGEEAAQELHRAFAVAEAEARRDVRDFIARLKMLDLVAEIEGDDANG